MSNDWKNEELKHLAVLWDTRPPITLSHTKKDWNRRAVSWEQGLRENESRRKRSEKRVKATVDYLVSMGALGPETDVIDIGCGPGRFVAEFAGIARHATGYDLSDSMVEYGREFCRERGISNVTFRSGDFKELDVEAEGLAGRYDLVFSSITPAMGYRDGYKKGMLMTNGWFFNACYVSSVDTLQEKLDQKLGIRTLRKDFGSGFYCMLNELFLTGMHPELKYYNEESFEAYDEDSALAEYAHVMLKDEGTPEQIEELKRAISQIGEAEGEIRSHKQWVYAWMIVDKKGRNVL